MLPVLLLRGLQLQDAQSGWQKDHLQKGLGLMCHVPVPDVTDGSSQWACLGLGLGFWCCFHLFQFRSPCPIRKKSLFWANLASNPKSQCVSQNLWHIPSYLHSHFHSFPLEGLVMREREKGTEPYTYGCSCTAAQEFRAVIIQIFLNFFPSKLIFPKLCRWDPLTKAKQLNHPACFLPPFPLACTGQFSWHHKASFLFQLFQFFFFI